VRGNASNDFNRTHAMRGFHNFFRIEAVFQGPARVLRGDYPRGIDQYAVEIEKDGETME
jgi:hypothetical protein